MICGYPIHHNLRRGLSFFLQDIPPLPAGWCLDLVFSTQARSFLSCTWCGDRLALAILWAYSPSLALRASTAMLNGVAAEAVATANTSVTRRDTIANTTAWAPQLRPYSHQSRRRMSDITYFGIQKLVAPDSASFLLFTERALLPTAITSLSAHMGRTTALHVLEQLNLRADRCWQIRLCFETCGGRRRCV